MWKILDNNKLCNYSYNQLVKYLQVIKNAECLTNSGFARIFAVLFFCIINQQQAMVYQKISYPIILVAGYFYMLNG
jgi:hypothetical protein